MEKIKELRDKTGAGIVDCKKALEEAGGDIEKAIEILRKKGIAKAAKRSDREASEGVVKVYNSEDGKEGLIIEFNAETDFVVRSDRFQSFVESVFTLAKDKKPATVEEVMAMPFESSNVKDALDNLSGVIGEKLDVKQCAYVATSGTVAAYSHMGGHIGVLVELDQSGKLDLAKDVAMHVAAASPRYNTPDEVPAEEVAKEKEIYREQLLKEGKPEAMIEKIMDGKVSKYYEEVCLIKQEYIKDDKKKVGEILDGAKVVRFFRFSLQSQASC